MAGGLGSFPEHHFRRVIPGDDAWSSTLDELRRSHEALREAIRGLDEARLEEIVPATQYPIYFPPHGMAQHDLYHAGQIALMKKVD